MDESANTREAKRVATAHRISVCAQRLTEERGFDGFTMDELAEAAGVSRRTLFNYFPSKVDAALGQPPELSAELLAEFHAGGPTGDLIDDLGALAAALLSVKEFSREEAALGQRVLRTEPRLLAAAHQRFQTVTEEFVGEILVREGKAHDERRARVAIRLLGSLFDVSLEHYLTDPDGRELVDIYADTVRTVRALFA